VQVLRVLSAGGSRWLTTRRLGAYLGVEGMATAT
jgi:hypothetical protein